MSDEDLEKLAEEAKNYPYPQPSAIDVSFFDLYKHSKKGKILFNTDKEFTYSEKEEIRYILKAPVYIDTFDVTFQNDCKVKDTKIHFIKPDGSFTHYIFEKNQDSISLSVKTLVTEIKFIPPTSFYFKKEKLHFQSIKVFGRTESELSSLEKASREIKTFHDQLKADAASLINTNKETLAKIQKAQADLDEEHTNLDDEISKFKKEIDELIESKAVYEKEVQTVETNLEKLKAQTAQVQNNHDSLITKEQTLKDSIEQKNLAITELNKKIVQEEQKLKEHEKNTNLIAYDVKGFVENAKSNIKVYIGLSVLPWILICAISIILACNADKIAGYALLEQGKVDLATVFWTRIPFAIIVSTILYISYEISIAFARKIIDLHQRILDLQKIGIIAKDVSEASLTNLDEFTDEEKYELRTKLKMDLLRSHLAKDFHIKDPFKVTNPSILTRFLKAKDTPKEKAPQEEAKVKPEETHAEE